MKCYHKLVPRVKMYSLSYLFFGLDEIFFRLYNNNINEKKGCHR